MWSLPGSVVAVRPVLIYTALRLGTFLATGAVLVGVSYALGYELNWLLLLAASALLSGLISMPLLSRPRGAMAASLAGSAGRMRQRVDAAASSEDREDRDGSTERK